MKALIAKVKPGVLLRKNSISATANLSLSQKIGVSLQKNINKMCL